ncbi:hypothetical protein ACW4FP_18060 [Paenarthrobacter ureafaciens]|jgi:hypothetical protein
MVAIAKLPIAKSKGTIVIGLRNSGAALLAVGLSLSAVGPAAASASQSPVQEAPAELNVLSAILESAIRGRNQQMVVGSGLEGAEQANMLLFSAKSKDTIAAVSMAMSFCPPAAS